jgi:hypothetical protein
MRSNDHQPGYGGIKMKKLTVVLAMVLAMYAPKVSYAGLEKATEKETEAETQTFSQKWIEIEKQILDISKEWNKSEKELLVTPFDLQSIQIQKGVTCPREMARVLIESASLQCGYVSILLRVYGYAARSSIYSSAFLDTAIQEYVMSCIEAIKKNREVTLKRLQYAYNEIEDKPSLVKIDKALDVLRSSLPLFDKTIEAIRSRPQ